jgi:hypothetical protein
MSSEKTRQTEKRKALWWVQQKDQGHYVAYDKYFLNKILCFQCAMRVWLQTQP